MVSPLVYLMNLDRARAAIISANAQYDLSQFASAIPLTLLYGIVIVGAAVFLASTAMTVYLGLGKREPKPAKAPAPAADIDEDLNLPTP